MHQIELPLEGPPFRLAGVCDMPVADDPEATAALMRVLSKARSAGCVRRAGIYADRDQDETANLPGFDWQLVIDRGVARGWLAAGVAFNTYVLTPRGTAVLDASIAAGVRPREQRA